MNAEEPEMKPGFLRGIYDAEPTPTPPVGGWDRIESSLHKTKRKPVWMLWLPAMLLVTLGGYWAFGPIDKQHGIITTSRSNIGAVSVVSGGSEASSSKAPKPSPASASEQNTINQLPNKQQVDELNDKQLYTMDDPTTSAGEEAVVTKNMHTMALPKSASESFSKTRVLSNSSPTAAQNAAPSSVSVGAVKHAKRNTTVLASSTESDETTKGANQSSDLNSQRSVSAKEEGTHSEIRKYRKRTRHSLVQTPMLAHANGTKATIMKVKNEGTIEASASTKRRKTYTSSSTDTPVEKRVGITKDDISTNPTSLTIAHADVSTMGESVAKSAIPDPSIGLASAPTPISADSVPHEKPQPKLVAEQRPTQVQEVVPTKKERAKRFTFEVGVRVLLRQRNASLAARADHTQLAWTQPQPKILPGIELFGGVGYKLSQSLQVGAGMGVGGWEEKLAIDVTPLAKEAHMAATATPGRYTMELPYESTYTQAANWRVLQTHTELWLRYKPKTLPLVLQAGPSLDMMHITGDSTTTPTGNMYRLGWAASMRFMPGRIFYEAGIRQPLGTSLSVPSLYKINYQFITVGIGYTW